MNGDFGVLNCADSGVGTGKFEKVGFERFDSGRFDAEMIDCFQLFETRDSVPDVEPGPDFPPC